MHSLYYCNNVQQPQFLVRHSYHTDTSAGETIGKRKKSSSYERLLAVKAAVAFFGR
jgi:hypothetical protein